MSTLTTKPKPRGWWHEQARELRAQGWTRKQIAERFGVSVPAVRNVLCPVAAQQNRDRVREFSAARYGVDLEWTEAKRASNRRSYARLRSQCVAAVAEALGV